MWFLRQDLTSENGAGVDVGFTVWVQGSGFRDQGLEFGVHGLGFRVSGLGTHLSRISRRVRPGLLSAPKISVSAVASIHT